MKSLVEVKELRRYKEFIWGWRILPMIKNAECSDCSDYKGLKSKGIEKIRQIA